MSLNFQDIQVYLPKFLSSESDRELYNCLKDFPGSNDSRIYSKYLKDSNLIYQGDGLKDMLVINLPDPKIGNGNCMVLSNTCDIDILNQRFLPSQIIYSPILSLSKYIKLLEDSRGITSQRIGSHIESIRKQEVTQIFFLPRYDGVIDESIVLLDHILNSPHDSIDRENLRERRLFILSNFGAYLFLLKLSIHFTRIRDGIDRG